MSTCATSVVLLVMAWISVFMVANGRTVANLGREIRSVEARQLRLWNVPTPSPGANPPPVKPAGPKP